MAGKYRVEVTATAEADLLGIWEFIARDSPDTAIRWLDATEKRILSLESFPLRCAIVPEAEDLGCPYRHLVCGNYRVIARVERTTVWAIRVLHGARLLDTTILEDR